MLISMSNETAHLLNTNDLFISVAINFVNFWGSLIDEIITKKEINFVPNMYLSYFIQKMESWFVFCFNSKLLVQLHWLCYTVTVEFLQFKFHFLISKSILHPCIHQSIPPVLIEHLLFAWQFQVLGIHK